MPLILPMFIFVHEENFSPSMKYPFLYLIIAIVLVSCSNVGDELPTFRLKSLDGEVITEQDLSGKITVINVWATWCPNCLNELDALNALEQMYRGNRSVNFLAVSDEDPAKIQSFLNRRQFNFKQIPRGTELTDAIQTKWVKTHPQHILLDRNLTVRYEYSGELDNVVETLGAEIDRLLIE
jgi:peroxiredoxin